MKKVLTFSTLFCAIGLTTNCVAMDPPPTLPLADIALPALPAEEQKKLAHEFEQFNASDKPQELRLALFAVASKLATTPLDERDADHEKSAAAVCERISRHYPNKTVRDTKFLYGIVLATQKPTPEDRHPFRRFYTPVEQLRETLKVNAAEQGAYQQKSEELSRAENTLSGQIAALQAQLKDAQSKKQSQLAELTMIVQANNTLQAHIACHGIALQKERDAIQANIIASIDTFIQLKKKLAAAAVTHEKTNYTEQLKPMPEKIEGDIKSLWYCMHYLKRIKQPDGTLTKTEELKWKWGSVDAQELGITNYAEYLEYKNK